MSAVILQLRDAVVGRLATGVADDEFSEEFTPRGAFVIDVDRDSSALDVVVVGTTEATDQTARDVDGTDHTIEIGVLKKVDASTIDSDTASLIELVEGIRDYLRNKDGAIDDAPDGAAWTPVEADWISSEISPLYDHARLREHYRFASVQRVVYRTYKSNNAGA